MISLHRSAKQACLDRGVGHGLHLRLQLSTTKRLYQLNRRVAGLGGPFNSKCDPRSVGPGGGLGREKVLGGRAPSRDPLCAAENLENVDAREIGRAQLSIDIAAYVLSDPRIAEALIDGAERGVVIRLYLDRSQFAEHGPTRGGVIEALLAHPNVTARVKGEGVLMHLKAYAVDGEVLRTGSGNFSRSGLADQDNDAIFITDPTIVDAFEGNFERIWARAPEHRRLGRELVEPTPLTRFVARLRQPQWAVALIPLTECGGDGFGDVE